MRPHALRVSVCLSQAGEMAYQLLSTCLTLHFNEIKVEKFGHGASIVAECYQQATFVGMLLTIRRRRTWPSVVNYKPTTVAYL